MRKLLFITITLILVAGSCTGTYFLTKHIIFKAAYAKGRYIGHKDGYDARVAEEEPIRLENAKQFTDLSDQYNQLSDDYNSLRTAVIKYVNTNQYKVAPSIHCNSMNYGIDNKFTSTNCY